MRFIEAEQFKNSPKMREIDMEFQCLSWLGNWVSVIINLHLGYPIQVRRFLFEFGA